MGNTSHFDEQYTYNNDNSLSSVSVSGSLMKKYTYDDCGQLTKASNKTNYPEISHASQSGVY